jgi:hypothetical protein
MQSRRRRSASEWTTLVKQWRASGLTTKEFAARHDLSAASLYWWRQRLSALGSVGAAPDDQASTSLALKNSKGTVTFREVHVSSPPVVSAGIEVLARSGHVIRVHGSVDAVALRAVLAAVERC